MKTRNNLLLLLMCLLLRPVFATPTTPTSDFIDNHDGTVTHKITGLTWMRCALGQTWTGSACTGTAANYTYEAAKKLTYDFAGNSDWRLPNIAELQTIVDRDTYDPAINTDVFANSPSDFFWSSSPYVGYSFNAWVVDFGYGYVYHDYNRSYAFPVRLVRASQSLVIGEATRMAEFTYYANGTVLHKRTGLIWQRCAVGQTWTGSTCTGTAGKYRFDVAQKITSRLAGYSDWRMPTVSELASIISYDRIPALNQIPFPNSPTYAFWSSSPSVGSAYGAWNVDFSDGYVNSYVRNYAFPVRLVRASQSWVIGLNKADLTIKLQASRHRLSIKQPLTYTATVNNTGSDTAKAASVVFYLAMNYITVDHLPADCQVNSTNIECKLGDLPVNASASRTLSISYTKRGGIGANALALTNSVESNYDNNLSHVAVTVQP